MLRIYSLIVKTAIEDDAEEFDLDFMVKVAASNFQASSRGAIGKTAILRSKQDDRSRDPLYNQLKMYSEIYRNLGLLRPVEQRLRFRPTILGLSLAIDFSGGEISKGITRECLLAMTFPNATSKSLGVEMHRPFRWLLMLMAELGGTITRHEMILGLLDIENDRKLNEFDKKVESILGLRKKSRSDLMESVSRVAESLNVQVNSLENYTRFPIGVLNSSITGWAESKPLVGIYDRKMIGLELTDYGVFSAKALDLKADIRICDFEDAQMTDRVHFSRFAYYSLLYRAGLRQPEFLSELDNSKLKSKTLIERLGIVSPSSYIFSPYLEESDEVLSLAESEE
jgi:hypothetical protein